MRTLPVPDRLLSGFAAVALILALGACSTPTMTATGVAPTAGEAPSRPAGPAVSRVRRSVVKVVSTIRAPEPLRPWAKGPARSYHATGVVIAGDRILTSARAVEYAEDIEVQAEDSGDEIPATVECAAPTINLAILKVTDPAFFAKHPPLPLATAMPQIKDTLLVYGYPAASTEVSVTNRVVTGVEFVPCSHCVSALRLTTDGGIDLGLMGAPVVTGGRLGGLVFARSGKSNPGFTYVIPAPEIALFLRSISHGRYSGKPGIYDRFQTLNNPALRAFLRLPASTTGIVVNRPYRNDAGYPLKKWDVVTRIGHTPIDDEGMIDADGGLRLKFTCLVQKLAGDGRVPLTIVRDGRTRQIELPVSNERPLLEPYLDGRYPSYFIYGPLVFTDATRRYLVAIRRSAAVVDLLSATHNPLYTREADKPAFPGEQLVVVSSPFFSDRLTEGYTSPVAAVVKFVDGIRVRNLRQLVTILRNAKGTYVRFEFYGEGREVLVFPRKEMQAATARILDDNNVRSQGSPDAMKAWKEKASS